MAGIQPRGTIWVKIFKMKGSCAHIGWSVKVIRLKEHSYQLLAI